MGTSEDFEGRTLAGRYRILHPVGRGGMGAVYEAEQLDLERRVAIKVLLDEDRPSVDRFVQEARATANLSCPHVVTVLDFGFDGVPYLVMELLRGRSLRALLRAETRLPVTRAAKIAAQMLNALAAAHRAGIVHRDVKPSNVFLVETCLPEDFVKVLDFGLAKLLGREGVKTTLGTFLGTPGYVAPEQVMGSKVDPRTDLHAVGVCLFEMIAGRRPWRSEGGPVLFGEILHEPAPPLRSLVADAPEELSTIVAKALEKDPRRRFQTAEEMLDALGPWLAQQEGRVLAKRTVPMAPAPGDPATVRDDRPPVDGPGSEARRARRAIRVVGVAGAALVLSSTVAAFALLRTKADEPSPVLAEPSTLVAPEPLEEEPDPDDEPEMESAFSARRAPSPPPEDSTDALEPTSPLRPGCTCVWKDQPLCSKRLRCSCVVPTGPLCPEEQRPGGCGRAFASYGGAGKANGAPCAGYLPVVDGQSKAAMGRLACECPARAARGRSGAPCDGFDSAGYVRRGAFRCGKDPGATP